MDHAMTDEEFSREADRLLSAAIYLMSCHARNGCPRLALMVGRHLELIARHPQAGDLVRETCQRLAAAWESVRQNDERRARDVPPESTLETLRHIIH
jgi:hypothetical protein